MAETLSDQAPLEENTNAQVISAEITPATSTTAEETTSATIEDEANSTAVKNTKAVPDNAETSPPPPENSTDNQLSEQIKPSSKVDAAKSEFELEEVIVEGQKNSTPLFQFNQLDKDIEQLELEQINNIRDLTRYDPGISVNEQGQGASSGYSIRGVDRNRVAISVDGMAQGQVFSPASTYTRQGEYGGTINEIEYENVKQIRISKGASSVLAGNGALGGAVLLESKQADDVIKLGQSYGLDYKGAFISKNNQWVNRLAMAGRTGWFEGLVQYTHRVGHEIQSHSNVSSQKLVFYFDPNDELLVARPKKYELEFSADDVWGPTREKSNPMDYSSKSWLINTGIRPNNRHYLGLVLEHTDQAYKTLNMTKLSYYRALISSGDREQHKWVNAWSQDNIHNKLRTGVEYRYLGGENKSWRPDSLHLRFDEQTIEMNNVYKHRRCAKKITLDCQATKNGQFARDLTTGTKDIKQRVRLNLAKSFKLLSAHHLVRLDLGTSKGKLNHKSVTSKTEYKFVCRPGTYNANCVLVPLYVQNWKNGTIRNNNSLEPISNNVEFAALQYKITPSRFLELALGVREETHRFASDNRFIKNQNYTILAKQADLVIKPIKNWQLAYQFSEGFRVPSMQQIYGVELITPGDLNNGINPEDITIPEIKPEKAISHEVGISYASAALLVRGSYFMADYLNLIDIFQKKGNDTKYKRTVYGNVQDAFVEGYNLMFDINLHELKKEMPSGLNAIMAYSRVRPRKRPTQLDASSDNFVNRSYMFDTIQPPRYVFALKYTSPNQNWGASAHYINSKEKDEDELIGLSLNPATAQTISRKKLPRASTTWQTLDISAWISIGKHSTLRGAIYNILDEQYSSWESLRQLGVDGISTTGSTNVVGLGAHRLTAPGRNFSATLELKF